MNRAKGIALGASVGEYGERMVRWAFNGLVMFGREAREEGRREDDEES